MSIDVERLTEAMAVAAGMREHQVRHLAVGTVIVYDRLLSKVESSDIAAKADRGTWREASKRLHDAGDDEDPDETVSHSGHYLDLDSPETAEALARALRGMKPCGDPDCPDRHFGWCDREVAAILAALREPGQ